MLSCCYLAPMEGVTGYVYRNTHHEFFGNLDKYFMPFLVPNQHRILSARERNDILPEHNQGMTVIPQIMTNSADGFLWAARELEKLGYEEINLNLGCPSGTVVSKGRGSGFLAYPGELNRFLEDVFSGTDMRISIKTRIGKNSPEEFPELMKIFNQYPLEELIIHPRIQTDYYKNAPNLQVFSEGLSQSRNPVVYNGNIFTTEEYRSFHESFPQVDTVMLGRGLIANPGLADEIRGEKPVELSRLKEFHDTLYRRYQETIPGGRNVLFKMKELWFYMSALFPDSEKYMKKIKKAEKTVDYEAAVSLLFRTWVSRKNT